MKVTGLARKLQVDPAFSLKIPIRGLKLAQNLGQPCEFLVQGEGWRRGAADRRAADQQVQHLVPTLVQLRVPR